MSRVAHEGAAVEVALDASAVLAERVEILTIFYIQDLVDTLEGWLANHICHIDVKLRPWVPAA